MITRIHTYPLLIVTLGWLNFTYNIAHVHAQIPIIEPEIEVNGAKPDKNLETKTAQENGGNKISTTTQAPTLATPTLKAPTLTAPTPSRLAPETKNENIEIEFLSPEKEIKTAKTPNPEKSETDLLLEEIEMISPARPTPTPQNTGGFTFDVFEEDNSTPTESSKTAENKTAENKTAENKTVENKTVENKTTGNKTAENTTLNQKETKSQKIELSNQKPPIQQKVTLKTNVTNATNATNVTSAPKLEETPQKEEKQKTAEKVNTIAKKQETVKPPKETTKETTKVTTKETAKETPEASQANIKTALAENPEESMEWLLMQLKEESLKKEIARSSLVPNQLQDEINFDDVPLGSALRLLAEQAGFNFVEPNLPDPNEKVSLRFQKITPLDAFMKIAKARGFAVITENGVTTLKRPDIKTPEFLIVKKYRLQHAQTKWVIQSVANLLNIQISTPSDTLTSYPAPDSSATLYGGSGGSSSGGSSGGAGGGGGGSGGSQNIGLPSAPRWPSSLPFDEPSYTSSDKTGGQGACVFIDRSANAIIVRASLEDQKMVSQYLESIDKPEPQILIETRVVEVTLSDKLLYGVDWSQALGKGFKIKGSATDIDLKNFSKVLSGGGQAWSLFLSVPETEVTIRAFQELGDGSVINMPRTMTRSNVPVSISSTVTDATPSYQISTGTGGTGGVSTPSGFNTFTTGMTIDVVPQILDNGMIDININPSVANKVGEQKIPATPTTPQQNIPIISSRSITTSAVVPTGMTIMLGGITEARKIENSGGIPILSRLPILGKTIFGNTEKSQERKTLIVFVTPKIIYPNQYDRVYTNEEEWNAMREGNRNNWESETIPLPQDKPIKAAIPIPHTMGR